MRDKPVHGTCRLCQKEALLVDSHIIPKFQFKPLKKIDGVFYILSTDPTTPEEKQQKGFTEHLFCTVCDNERLQRNESHLARVLHGGYPLDVQADRRILLVKGYDYRRVKNALLSILWRMSLSQHEFFKEVNLGPIHEERLRDLLLRDLSPGEEEYAVSLTVPYIDGQHYAGWIMPPDCVRLEHNRLYRVLISGLLFTFDIGSAPPADIIRPLILRQTQWQVLKAEVREIPFLISACARVGRAKTIRDKALP